MENSTLGYFNYNFYLNIVQCIHLTLESLYAVNHLQVTTNKELDINV